MPDTNISGAPPETIRAILFREGEHWVGQCIEYDICTQGKTLGELYERLSLTVQFEREESVKRNGEPFRGIPPAPSRFEDMWHRQAGTFTPARQSVSGKQLDLALCA